MYFFFILSLFESNFLINSVAGQNEGSIKKIITHLGCNCNLNLTGYFFADAAPSPISIKNAQELEKSIEKAETALNELNQTLDHLIDHIGLNGRKTEIGNSLKIPN